MQPPWRCRLTEVKRRPQGKLIGAAMSNPRAYIACLPNGSARPPSVCRSRLRRDRAIAWLVSDQAGYVTGIALPVDAGFTAR
jgi:hypothetical protein